MRTLPKSRTRRLVAATLAALLAGPVMGTVGSVDAATGTVTVTAKLAAGYRMLAVSKAGKAYMATSSGGKVTLKGIPKADTNAMTLSVVSTSGAYVGPVMLKYMASAKKKATTISKAKTGYTALKQASKSTLSLGTVSVKGNYAYTSLKASIPVAGSAVAVTAGVPPSRENLGKSKVQGAGVRSAADPTENPAGGDADKDGLPAFVDVDDDNDGKLDLVDSTFFSTETKSDGTLLGEANIFTALICGGDCVNLNAFNIDRPSDNAVAAERLNKMINTFQGVFFSFNATTKYFSSRPDAKFGYFNVDCTGISWCSGASSRAVTISPDYDSGNQPADNALPLTGGSSNYADFCGSKVIARNPLNPGAKPAAWPADTSYDQSMDEWLFSTCDPDNDGLPNIIPSKGTLQNGFSWINEIKPRMPGPEGLKVGDTIRYNITDGTGKSVASSSQVISGVIQTAPSLRTWQEGAGQPVTIHAADGTYTVPAQAGSPAGNTLTLTFWRPQRAGIGTETSWQDVGGLGYQVQGPKGGCTITAATTSAGASLQVINNSKGSVVVDPAADASPDPANFIQATVDITNCKTGQGQWRVMASDRAGNSTNFSWQGPRPQQ
ncbi:MAG: hypothetical protein ACKOFF_05280 [Acidimicrobiales bacterium]